MDPEDSARQLYIWLHEKGSSVDGLTPAVGVEHMLSFYETVRAEGCRLEEDGDMVLFQWGTFDWGEGRFFNFDMTRQFIIADADDDDGLFQLHMTFLYLPTDALIGLGSGNRWCSTPDELPEFREFVLGTPAYQAVARQRAAKIQIDFEPAG